MAIRDSDTVKQSMKDYIESKVQPVDTGDGSRLEQLYISPISNEVGTSFTEVEDAQTAQNVASPSSISNDELEDLAYNWGLTRKGANAATGFVTFSAITQPAENIRIGNQDGSGGIIVSTRKQDDGSTVTFTTTSTVFLLSSATADSDGYYSISAAIEASEPGENGNVPASSIVILNSSVQGIDFINNTIATTGGEVEETNAALATRIKAKSRGLHKGIQDGLRSLSLSITNVIDAAVVNPNDSEMTRKVDGGGADVYILGTNDTSYQQSFSYDSDNDSVTLTRSPVDRIVTLAGLVGLTVNTFLQGTDYQFSQDTSSSSGYSTRASDQLEWLSGTKPNEGATCIATYVYDKNIRDIQDLIDQVDSHFVTADNLVKQGTEVLVDITADVTKNTGEDSDQIESAVTTSITNFINGFLLGEDLQRSDLINEIKGVSGVDNVSLDVFKYRTSSTSETNTINSDKTDFLRVDSSSITVNVS